MIFLDHTMEWIRGEIFEAWMLILFGVTLLALAALFWFAARTPPIQTLFWPFAIIGLLWGGAGAFSLYNNTSRLTSYEQTYQTVGAEQFVQIERKRVDGFIWAYKYLLITWSIAIVLGLIAFMVWGGITGRGVGLGLILLGLGGLMVDHTSEQNAHDYDKHVKQAAAIRAGLDTAIHERTSK